MLFSSLRALTCAAILGIGLIGCGDSPTVVSIQFDDAHVDQLAAIDLLAKYDIKATYYLPHPRLEAGGKYMTIDDALGLQAAGHEIGGHTITHPQLPELSREEQRKEICEDREHLQLAGFTVDNFSYPAGAHNATTEALVAECGYESARTSGGLCEQPGIFDFCDQAESLPPQYVFATRTHGSMRRQHIPDRMRALITDPYENGGGWVQLIFHHVCDDCNDYGISVDEMDSFLSWLTNEREAGRVQVKTTREVIRGL